MLEPQYLRYLYTKFCLLHAPSTAGMDHPGHGNPWKPVPCSALTNDTRIHGDLRQVATVLSFMQSKSRSINVHFYLHLVKLEGSFYHLDDKVIDDAVDEIARQHELGFEGTYCPLASFLDMDDALLHHPNQEMIYTTELRIDDRGVHFMRVWFQCGVTEDDALALFNDTSPALYCIPQHNNNRVKSCKAYKCECHNKPALKVQMRQSIQMECPSTVQLSISLKSDIIYADITGHNHEWSYAIDCKKPIDQELVTYIKERSKA